MKILIYTTAFVGYFIVEFIINLFFTWKIKSIGEDKYTQAAIAGSIATFLFIASIFLGTIITYLTGLDGTSWKTWEQVTLALIICLGMAIGNFTATVSIPKIERKIKGNKNGK